MRGADFWQFPSGAKVYGSPPRAWGRRLAAGLGLIRIAVHPHVRGADFVAGIVIAALCGSPPRAWGRRATRYSMAHGPAVHPHVRGADAPLGMPMVSHSPVHPHVRGADIIRGYSRGEIVGSPPRAWGRHPVGQGNDADGRFTPTCVGQTVVLFGKTIASAVHPHVRGADIGLTNHTG